MNIETAASNVLRHYPTIYLACHTRHDRPRNNEHGISRRDSQILQHLDRAPPYTAGELAIHLGIGAPALSAAIDRLQTLELARRRPLESDRRKVQLLLTDKGRAVMDSASVLEPELVQELMSTLNTEQRNAAVRGLEILATAARQLMEERSAT